MGTARPSGSGSDDHLIAPGVRGWLESPLADAIVPDCLMVSGWAFVTGATIAGIWATGFGSRRPLQFGLRRDDVARVYAGEPTAPHSGFAAYLELDGPPSARMRLEIWAALGDGRSIRLFTRLITVGSAGDPSESESPQSAVWPQLRRAARLAVERPRSLLSGRSWLNACTLLLRAWSNRPNPAPARPVHDITARKALARTSRAFLASFLTAGSRLGLKTSAAPVVSVVVIVWNRADLTLSCLRALATETEIATEVIVVDNGSTDETTDLLSRIDGAIVIRNSSNLGFTVSANLGAKAARGDFLLFLNNDAELMPGSIQQLVDTARRASSIGAVGGKLVFPDGRLQEAGSIIWSDGSCEAYGRGSDPAAPEYNFERQVDFCSGALLLTRRAPFERLGGFDERYRPAYYEDADYCARLWADGFSVVYQPKAVAIHHEFGSATSRDAGIELQRARRPIFVSRHAGWLSSQASKTSDALAARSHPHGQASVLFIDDAVPDPRLGAGFPRAAALLEALRDLGYLITIYVTREGHRTSHPHESFRAVEVVAGGPAGLRTFFASRRHHHLVIVSRPHNMQYVKAAVGSDLSALGAPCIYDAEAIYALREIGRRRLVGPPMTHAESQASIDGELGLTRGCAAVLVVSEAERRLFAATEIRNVFVVGHAVDARPTPNAFERRQTILFVGAFGPDSPNEDAVLFFCRDVLPALRASGCAALIAVGGARIPDHLKAQADATVSWHSDVGDLTPLYDNARVFVAPTRYSAGIPLKVVEAAARGVPIVCTPLVADQLGWSSGTELLAAASPAEFARALTSVHADPELWLRLREAALKRVASQYSSTVFRSALHTALHVSARFSAGPG
jgi:GT2 family glycosyltransferase